MADSTRRITRADLAELETQSLHPARNWSKADVFIAEWPPDSGCRIVIKDLRRRALWFRLLVGRRVFRREWNALRTLSGIEGVPAVIARPSADVLVLEYRPGQAVSLLQFEGKALPPGTVEKFEKLVAVLHAHGVTHGDLHGDNILVDVSGRVTLIDWATASVFGTHPRGARMWAFEEWKALDQRAVAKIKAHYAPQLVNDGEITLLINGGSRLYRGVKSLRHGWQRLRGRDTSALRAAALARYRELMPNVPAKDD